MSRSCNLMVFLSLDSVRSGDHDTLPLFHLGPLPLLHFYAICHLLTIPRPCHHSSVRLWDHDVLPSGTFVCLGLSAFPMISEVFFLNLFLSPLEVACPCYYFWRLYLGYVAHPDWILEHAPPRFYFWNIFDLTIFLKYPQPRVPLSHLFDHQLYTIWPPRVQLLYQKALAFWLPLSRASGYKNNLQLIHTMNVGYILQDFSFVLCHSVYFNYFCFVLLHPTSSLVFEDTIKTFPRTILRSSSACWAQTLVGDH